MGASSPAIDFKRLRLSSGDVIKLGVFYLYSHTEYSLDIAENIVSWKVDLSDAVLCNSHFSGSNHGLWLKILEKLNDNDFQFCV